MKTLDILQQPYSDDTLIYNENSECYELTLQYVKSLTDRVPYRNDSITKQRIKQNSQRVYHYIVNHSNTANRQVIQFLLNRTENGRKFLIEALTSQMLADMDYAYNDILRRPIINGATGQEGNRDNYRLNAISLETEEIIDDSVGYFGFNICVLYAFSPYLFKLAREYED